MSKSVQAVALGWKGVLLLWTEQELATAAWPEDRWMDRLGPACSACSGGKQIVLVQDDQPLGYDSRHQPSWWDTRLQADDKISKSTCCLETQKGVARVWAKHCWAFTLHSSCSSSKHEFDGFGVASSKLQVTPRKTEEDFQQINGTFADVATQGTTSLSNSKLPDPEV